MLGWSKRRLLQSLLKLDGERFVHAFNLVSRAYWRYPMTVAWSADGHYVVRDDTGATLHVARKERVWLYAHGIQQRLDHLAFAYRLQHVLFSRDSVLVDCGANIGELSVAAQKRGAERVIAVEPEGLEASCIRHNLGSAAEIVEGVLWKEDGELDLFSKPESADSSVVPTSEGRKKAVTALTLPTVLEKARVTHVRLLKLEAEGAEPEVLAGALPALPNIDFISADLGPERGAERATTVAPVANVLYEHGYELVDVYQPRLICLFKRRDASER